MGRRGVIKGPLESTKYFILLAMAEGPEHGAAIREQIVGDTIGVYLRDSTLYAALQSLLKRGLIEERGGVSRQTRIYQLTETGRSVLEHEARIHERAVQLSKARLRWR